MGDGGGAGNAKKDFWVNGLRALAAEADLEKIASRTIGRMDLTEGRRHPGTDALLCAALEAFDKAPTATAGIQDVCLRIHQEFTDLCSAEYGEVGVTFQNPEHPRDSLIRLEAWHGKNIFPRAKNVHRGMLIATRLAGFVMNPGTTFKGLYGAMARTNMPMVSNDCENDPQHIKMPKGHTPMKNLLGLPLWTDSGVEPGRWHQPRTGIDEEEDDEDEGTHIGFEYEPEPGQHQDFPLGDKDKEMIGLYYFANTAMPGGFSQEFVSSLSVLQWGLGLLFYIARKMELAEAPDAHPAFRPAREEVVQSQAKL